MSLNGASRVEVREAEPRVRAVVGTPTAIAAAIGVTERGPVREPVPCDSFDEYLTMFGGFTSDSDLALAAMTFFDAGGGRLWVSRTVHYDDVLDPDSGTASRASADMAAQTGAVATRARFVIPAGPWFVEDGDELKLTTDGGSEEVLRIDARRAELLSAATFPTGFTGGEKVDVQVGQIVSTVTFEASDQTPEDVARRVNSQIRLASASVAAGQVLIQTDLAGSGVRLRVASGGTNDVLLFPTTEASGSGNVVDQSVVWADQLGPLFSVFTDVLAEPRAGDGSLDVVSRSVGTSATIDVGTTRLAQLFGLPAQVTGGAAPGSGTALTVTGRDPGAYANRIEVAVSDGDESDHFDLHVIEDGVHRESHTRLSMLANSDRYAPDVVNDARRGSILITLDDAGLEGAPLPAVQTVTLTGGDDGLSGLDDGDFVGTETGGTGLYALDKVDEISTLMVPGRATPATHHQMAAYAEHHRKGRMLCVLDAPPDSLAQDVRDYVTNIAQLSGITDFAAMYWPRPLVRNPKRSVFGQDETVPVPASGFVAGKFAHNDRARLGGVHKSPAGVEVGRLPGVLGFETDEVLDERKRGLVFDALVNPLTSDSVYPPYIDGARTLKLTGNFGYVGERRGVNFIKSTVDRALQYARHGDNTEDLRAGIERTIEGFLVDQMKVGAFASKIQEEAFFIEFPLELNAPNLIFVRIGLATNKPTEFIIVEFSQAVGRAAA